MKKNLHSFLFIFLVISTFFLSGCGNNFIKMDGQAMEPTFKDGDILFVDKGSYTPTREDIIVYGKKSSTNQTVHIVKRIIALPGQTVDLIDGYVYVDGKKIDEPYCTQLTFPADPSIEYPITVKDNHVFVLGDNRKNSMDSRYSSFGQIPFEAIVGKVTGSKSN